MAGFYRSSYTNIHGESKIMASTQFESLDARRAFPCWDEPSRKAVFGLSLKIPSHLSCLSNMPVKCCTSYSDNTKRVDFMDSPKMSTYLLAFIVGEFDVLQKRTAHGVLVGVYTPPGKVESGKFALDCACKALDAYDDFFGIKYPLIKLDMVAIPEFAAGAMVSVISIVLFLSRGEVCWKHSVDRIRFRKTHYRRGFVSCAFSFYPF